MSVELKPSDLLSCTLAIVAVLLNGTLLASMYKERKKIFLSRISYLVGNLAFADFLNGLFFVVLMQPIISMRYKDHLVEFLSLPLTWMALCASCATLLLMSVERLVVVALPMTWSTILNKRRTLLGIFLVWITSIAAGLWVGYKKYYAQFFVCVFIEVSATNSIIIHFYVLWVLRRGAKQRFQMTEDQQQSQAFLKENVAHKKVTTVVTILLVVLIITCAPYLVCTQMLIVNLTFDKTLHQKVNVHIFIIIYDYSVAFMYINFLCNSIIYAWRLRMCRKAFFSLVGRSISL